MSEILTTNGLKPEVEAAFFAGIEAGKRRAPIEDNPYAVNAIFDPDQLSAAWLKGRKDALDRRYTKRRHSGGWNRC